MNGPAPIGCRRGFTLLEVLIAIALILGLVGSMFAFMFDLLSSRKRALDYTAKQLAATTLIERVEADLMSCLVGDRTSGAGIRGEGDRLRILTRAVAASLAERGIDDPAVFGDLQLVEYRFNQQSRLIEARRSVLGDSQTADAPFAPLGNPVYKVRFRYHDATAWRDSFDSLSADRLPLAVEIAVWFSPWPGEEADLLPDDEADDAARPSRLTFDAAAGFDERAFAEASDLDQFDEPQPDRIRVIIVPDAAPDDAFADENGQSLGAGAFTLGP